MPGARRGGLSGDHGGNDPEIPVNCREPLRGTGDDARPDHPLWDAMHQEVDDAWADDVLVDDHVLGRRRDRALQFWAAHISDRPPTGGFSCDGCPTAPRCAWAFDSYNTDGDCLAMK